MKILSAEDLRRADLETIKKQGISSVDLMERAANRLFETIRNDYSIYEDHFFILCGAGNNGGDGLALARILFQSGAEVTALLVESENYSEDNIHNQKLVDFKKIKLSDQLDFPEKAIVIDALFGFGLNRGLDSQWQKLVKQINASNCRIISIDLPSGMIPDKVMSEKDIFVDADRVYTFHSLKKSFLLPDNNFNGEFKIIDIGLEPAESESQDYYLQESFIKKLLKPNLKFSHKGTFGHALIIGGSRGKIGSVILSSRAALRTGCGLITVFTPESGFIPLQTSFPEAMVITDPNHGFITALPEYTRPFKGIGLGIGIGTHPQTINALGRFLKQPNLPPLVLDADALNILSARREYLRFLPANSILTPHPGELKRLIGPWESDIAKIEKVKSLAEIYKLIVVVKGAYSQIVMPDGRTYFCSTGNAGMATAGSGDVLTGVIASLLAQGYSQEKAALIGVYLHGLAGDLVSHNMNFKSMIASDIVSYLPHAWDQLYA